MVRQTVVSLLFRLCEIITALMKLSQEDQRSAGLHSEIGSPKPTKSSIFSPSVQNSPIIPINRVDCQSVTSEVPSPGKRLWVPSPSCQELRHSKETRVSSWAIRLLRQWAPRIVTFPRNLIWGKAEASGNQLPPSTVFTICPPIWKETLDNEDRPRDQNWTHSGFLLKPKPQISLPLSKTLSGSLSLFPKPSH